MPRRLSAADARALDSVAAGPSFSWAGTLNVSRPDLTVLLQSVRDPHARQYLRSDIARLVTAFGTLLGRRHLYASLSVLRHDACAKLHADSVTLRLICTYSGPGTEWVSNEDVARDNLCRIDVNFETANRSVLRRPDAVRHCATGDVIVLKGESFPGNQGRGAVHRSPPVEESRRSRLVLKLDENKCGC